MKKTCFGSALLIPDLFWCFKHFPNLVIPSHPSLQQGHTTHTLYYIYLYIIVLQYSGCTLQKCFVSHPWLQILICYSSHLSLPHGKHRIEYFYKRKCFATLEEIVKSELRQKSMLFILCEDICIYYSDFILEDCCSLGLNGQGQPEDIHFGSTGQDANIMSLFWDSLSPYN